MMTGCPMMGGAGGPLMMIGMGIVGLLTITLLILGIAALIKYLRNSSSRSQVDARST